MLAASTPEAVSLAHSASLPPVLAQVLAMRGIRTAAEAEGFLRPQFDALHDPYAMLGMHAAVTRIQQAIRELQPILIYGDYDVDGTLATVLLKTAIEMLGGLCRFHVPHRIREGYGMQPEPLTRAAAEGVRLVISVDNGIRAFAAADHARQLGLELIVTDHHLPDEAGIPGVFTVLNPNQPGCGYPSKTICGSGVAFKLAQALLEAADRPRARQKILPSFLKLLAIATIADAVPLTGENRIFAALGIEQLARPVHPGLRCLMELAEIPPHPHRITAREIGFRLAPRLNAAGRMDVATDVVDLFTTRDAIRARELAEKLHRLNQERRATEQAALAEIEQYLQEQALLGDVRCLVLDGHTWHRGVIGILASRVVDRCGRPALVLTHADGHAHGSGRSVQGFHLLDAISSCADLFTRFGGHAHAVGFSLPSARVPELRRRMEIYATDNLQVVDAAPELHCAAELPLEQLTPEMEAWLDRLAPYGMDNPEPVFIARSLRVQGAPRLMQERHIRLRLCPASGEKPCAAIGWNLAAALSAQGIEEGSRIDIAYRLRAEKDSFSGGIEVEIVDLCLSELS